MQRQATFEPRELGSTLGATRCPGLASPRGTGVVTGEAIHSKPSQGMPVHI